MMRRVRFQLVRRVAISALIALCTIGLIAPAANADATDTFDSTAAANWAIANYSNTDASSWRDSGVDDHCAEFVSAALHAGGLKYTGDWRPNSAERAWEVKSKKAYYNAEGLYNWITRNGWVTIITLPREQANAAVFYDTSMIAPGDVIFYDWDGPDADDTSRTHAAIVSAVNPREIDVVEQGAGNDHANRQWNLSATPGHEGVPQYELEPDMVAYLLHWNR